MARNKNRGGSKRRTSDFAVFIRDIANKFNKGGFINRSQLKDMSVRPSHERITSKNGLKKVLVVKSIYPNYKGCISEVASNVAGSLGGMAITSIITEPTNFNVIHTDRYKSQYKAAVKAYAGVEAFAGEAKANGENLSMGVDLRQGRKRVKLSNQDIYNAKVRYESYLYVDKVISSGGTLNFSYVNIEVMAPNEKSLDKIIDAITNKLSVEGVTVKTLEGSTDYYLSNFSPTGIKGDKDNKPINSMLFSEDNVAAVLPTGVPGLSCSGNGTLIGVSQVSHFPFFGEFNKTGQAQNIVICGSSGWGKTYMAFQIALQSILGGQHVTALDVKGGEWEKLGRVCEDFPYIVISMGTGQGKFVNMLRLDDLDLPADVCVDFYRNAVSGLIHLFAIVSGFDQDVYKKEYPDFLSIMSDTIELLYYEKGVRKENPYTYRYSKDLTYKDIYKSLLGYLDSSSIKESPELRQLGLTILRRIEPFCNGNGIFTGMFEHEVTLAEIIDYPLVIWSLDKNKNKDLGIMDAIRTVQIQSVSKKKQMVRKLNKQSTVEFYEELQRKDQVRSLLPYIVDTVSGGRSDNLTTFILCNSLTIFDKDSTEELRIIASNLTSFIFGKLSEGDVDTAVNKLGCKKIEHYLREIQELNPMSFSDKEAKPFAAYINNGEEIKYDKITTCLPSSLGGQLKTRDTIS